MSPQLHVRQAPMSEALERILREIDECLGYPPPNEDAVPEEDQDD